MFFLKTHDKKAGNVPASREIRRFKSVIEIARKTVLFSAVAASAILADPVPFKNDTTSYKPDCFEIMAAKTHSQSNHRVNGGFLVELGILAGFLTVASWIGRKHENGRPPAGRLDPKGRLTF